MKLNNLDLNKIHTFLVVARNGGYTGAMAELGLSRSAISQNIVGLERTLGAPLFKRVGKKLQLTEDSLLFYRRMAEAYSHIDHSLDELTHKASGCQGEIRIGAYLEFARQRMGRFFSSFQKRHPETQLHFRFDSPTRIQKLLENGRLDLSLSIFSHAQSKSILSTQAYEEELVLISATLLGPAKTLRAELEALPWIDYFASHQLSQRWWSTHYGVRKPKIRVAAYAATADMVLELVSQQMGVGVVPRYVLTQNKEGPPVHIIRPTAKRLVDFIWLNHHKVPSQPPQVRIFLEELCVFLGLQKSKPSFGRSTKLRQKAPVLP